MNDDAYNYSRFVMSKEAPALLGFPEHPLRVGQKAPDYLLADLDTGSEVRLRDIWGSGIAVIEFGSFT